MTDSSSLARWFRMAARSLVLFALFVIVGCGGKVVGDADDGGTPTPDVPKSETGDPKYLRCDEKLAPSWGIACDGTSGVDHGELCVTPQGIDECRALTNGCSGPSPDEILLSCDPGFFSRPGAKFGADIDENGCVTSIEWALVDPASVQCAIDRLTSVRFPCTGSTSITTPCKPFR